MLMNKSDRHFIIDFAASHSLDDLLTAVLDIIEKATQSQISFFHFIAGDEKNIALHQWSSNTLKNFCRVPSREKHYSVDQAGIWVDCIRLKKPVIHNDYAGLPHRKGLPAGHAPIERELIVPVVRRNRVVAVLGVGNKPSEYTQIDVETVDNFADMAWEIIQKKRDEEELSHRENVESALSGLASLLLTTTDIEEISARVLDTARELTHCDYGFVGTFDAQSGRFVSHTMTQEIWRECRIQDKSIVFDKSCGLWGWVLENKKPVMVNDIESDPRSSGTPHGHIGITAFLGVPAILDDQVVGQIALANPARRFVNMDLRIVEKLATLFAMAIQRQKYEKSLLEAQTRKTEEFENLVEQRTAELKKSNILLEKVFNSQQDAIFILNDSFVPLVVNCNRSALKMFEETLDELIEHPVEYLAAPSGINRFRTFLSDYHQRAVRSPIREFQMKDKQGRVFPAEVSVSPLMQESNRSFGSVLFIRDISRIKEAIEANKKTEERLRLILDTVSDAFWDWRLDTGEVYFSSRYYTMLGYLPYEFPQAFDTWISLLHPEDRTMTEEIVSRSIRCREPFEIEFRMRTKANTYRWILGRGKIVEKDAEGNVTRMVGTHIDFTERKNMEGRLRHSQKMEAMGVLAGGIAHDFNNILSAVVGYAELAAEEISEGSKAFKRVKGILAASERARNLISQILTFSRKQDKNLQPMNIQLVLKEALSFMRASLPSTVHIDAPIPAELPNIMGDPDQIQQLIINLMANAAHAMKQTGTIHIEIDCVKIGNTSDQPLLELKPGLFVRLVVSDTGCGIPSNIMPKIFDPFFTTKEKGIGTGLGLSTVHGIVKEHGGGIRVDSTPGVGTRFEVYLPVTIRDSSETGIENEIPPEGAERILIVDDEEVLPHILKDMLESLGYGVTALTSSRQALELFEKHPENFDILLSDITMPDLTGIDLTRLFKTIRPNIPVILWSGNNSSVTEQRARESGVFQVMRKPFKRMDIAVAIRKALDTTGEIKLISK